MNIKNIEDKFSINKWYIYNNPIFKPFIDAHFNHFENNKYKLFHIYILNFKRLVPLFHDYVSDLPSYMTDINNIFTKKNTINFKNNIVKKWFNTWKATYIGLTYFKQENKYFPLFLYFNNDNILEDNNYEVSGFFIGNLSGTIIHDVKEFSQIKNKYINIEEDLYISYKKQIKSLYANIKEMSELTRQNN